MPNESYSVTDSITRSTQTLLIWISITVSWSRSGPPAIFQLNILFLCANFFDDIASEEFDDDDLLCLLPLFNCLLGNTGDLAGLVLYSFSEAGWGTGEVDKGASCLGWKSLCLVAGLELCSPLLDTGDGVVELLEKSLPPYKYHTRLMSFRVYIVTGIGKWSGLCNWSVNAF